MSLKRHIELEAEYSKYIITPLCWLNFIGHPAYWLIWTYIHPQPYDSLMLRCSATIFSLAILLRSYWPQRTKKYFPIIWIVYGAYILPFLFTFIGLKNQFNFVWSVCHMGMIFLLILYTAQTSTMLFSVLIGTIAGIVAFTIDTQPNTLPLLPIEYLPLFIFGIITGLLLNHFSMKGISEYEGKLISERQKSASIKSLAGSIAHEMRNPLAQIHGNLQLVQMQTPDLNNNGYISNAYRVIQNGLQVIDMTMDAIRDRPINRDRFTLLSARDLVLESVADFAYTEAEHAGRVSVRGEDFEIMADPVMLKYVLYNLIKNALYYVKTLPDATIVISLTAQQIEVRDTGPGIAADVIPKLFDSFYTSHEQGGTGLGLSYCKRTMTSLGGDIHCHSALGHYTAFVLSFPVLSKQQVEGTGGFRASLPK